MKSTLSLIGALMSIGQVSGSRLPYSHFSNTSDDPKPFDLTPEQTRTHTEGT